MSRRGCKVIGLIVLMIGVSSVGQADFCEDLEVILASAQDGFGEVRGDLISRHVDPLSDTRVVWQCTLALTGAETCEVEWRRQTYSYNTFWHKQSEEANAEAFAALEELLGGCGLTQKEASKSGRSLWFVSGDETNLDVILAHNDRRVRLSFTASGFPNP
jgi:hypothetical protein